MYLEQKELTQSQPGVNREVVPRKQRLCSININMSYISSPSDKAAEA
jgi:hypothetical protein